MTIEHDARAQVANLDRARVDEFRTLLSEQRTGLLERLGRLDGEDGVSAAEIAADATLAHAVETLEEVEAALHRIDAGTYGECEVCHEAIPVERLEVVPTAARCVRCQTRSVSILG